MVNCRHQTEFFFVILIMIEKSLLLVISLLFVITLLTMLSRKMKISYPIFLVIAGLIISVMPGVPDIKINPDFVFLIFLPPVLFAAAWQMPWHEFWKTKRSIAMLGFGLVFFTSTIIAFLSHSLIPGFTLALGFVLGGIISPPDAVAATSVLKDLKVPHNVVTLLEGESLVNDASSLIVFRFALITVVTSRFNVWNASKDFFLVVGIGILIGLAIAFVVYIIHKYLPTTAAIDAALTLTTPYVMYLVAESFHYSGVLSVVAGGLFLSYRSHDFLTYESRLNIGGLWETLTFLLNGFIFILIGLQMPYIVNNFTENTVKEALYYGLIISLAVILIRILWVYTVTYIRKVFKKRAHPQEPALTSKETFLIAWCGMRGVVSLAAALAIPFYIRDEVQFPYRYLILFITFVVIIVTLVIQGLSISPLIKLLKIEDRDVDKQLLHDHLLNLQLAEASLAFIDSNYQDDLKNNEPFRLVRNRYEKMVQHSREKANLEQRQLTEGEDDFMPRFGQMMLELIEVKRERLTTYMQNQEFGEELIREKQWELDLEEARLRSREE